MKIKYENRKCKKCGKKMSNDSKGKLCQKCQDKKVKTGKKIIAGLGTLAVLVFTLGRRKK